MDIVRRQHVFEKIIGPSLYAGIQFNARGGAIRWYPMRQSRAVVLDPERGFGQPILAEFGVPTIAIAEALEAEKGDIDRVAQLFEIPRDAVVKARTYEQRLVAK